MVYALYVHMWPKDAPRGLVGTQRPWDWPGFWFWLPQSLEGQRTHGWGLSYPRLEGTCPEGGWSLGGPPRSQPNIILQGPPYIALMETHAETPHSDL